MSYCSKCDAYVDEIMPSCPKCNTFLRTINMNQALALRRINWSSKPVVALTNGILLGAGTALVLIGLVGAIALNSSYSSLSDFLVYNGAGRSAVSSILRSIVSLISLSVAGFIFGFYMLVLGLLNQVSRAAHEAFERRDKTARLGSGIMGGGVVLAILSTSNFVERLYIPEPGLFMHVDFIFVWVGITMLLVGILLLLKAKAKPK
jgi:hypothetical protein